MTIGEFFHAGGYGFYIWSSFGMTAALLVAELSFLRRQRQNVIKRLKRLARLQVKDA